MPHKMTLFSPFSWVIFESSLINVGTFVYPAQLSGHNPFFSSCNFKKTTKWENSTPHKNEIKQTGITKNVPVVVACTSHLHTQKKPKPFQADGFLLSLH